MEVIMGKKFTNKKKNKINSSSLPKKEWASSGYYEDRQRSGIGISDYMLTSNLVSDYEKLTNEEKTVLVMKAREGCKESLDRLIKIYSRLVIRLAKECKARGYKADVEDLIQEGMLGVHRSVMHTYDSSKGALTTNVYSHIFSRQSRYEMNHDDVIRTPNMHDRLHVTFLSEIELENEDGNTGSFEIPDMRVEQEMEAFIKFNTLSKAVGRVHCTLNQIDQRYREVIQMRLIEGMTLDQMALSCRVTLTKTPCTRERARQIYLQAWTRFLVKYVELYGDDLGPQEKAMVEASKKKALKTTEIKNKSANTARKRLSVELFEAGVMNEKGKFLEENIHDGLPADILEKIAILRKRRAFQDKYAKQHRDKINAAARNRRTKKEQDEALRIVEQNRKRFGNDAKGK